MKQLLMLAAIFLAFQAHAEIYKCKNDKGQITYQQTTCQAATVGKINKVPDVPIEEQMRAQNRTNSIIESNRNIEEARELERKRLDEKKTKYDLEKKAEESAKRKMELEILEKRAEASRRALKEASEESRSKKTLHCRPDYAGGLYCD